MTYIFPTAMLTVLLATSAITPASYADTFMMNTVNAKTKKWSPPIKPFKLKAPFAPGRYNWNAGHRGIDIQGSAKIPIIAPAPGTVHFKGRIAEKNSLSIKHEGNIRSTYEPVISSLKKGDAVTKGQVIGYLLPGGHCNFCLHFGVKTTEKYLNPLLFLNIQRSILLPR
ncbi:MAG: M23 family metallopeptidase [Micrococcaceae bacterium]